MLRRCEQVLLAGYDGHGIDMDPLWGRTRLGSDVAPRFGEKEAGALIQSLRVGVEAVGWLVVGLGRRVDRHDKRKSIGVEMAPVHVGLRVSELVEVNVNVIGDKMVERVVVEGAESHHRINRSRVYKHHRKWPTTTTV